MKIFYTDGSTRIRNQKGAENIGGWGVVCFDSEEEELMVYHEYDSSNNTTNNREELKALLCALNYADEHFPNEECIIYSDSAYVVNSCNDWIYRWAMNGWKNSKKQTVENLDLMQEIWSHIKQDFYHCTIKRVDGHVGVIGNELADALSTGHLKIFAALLDTYNIQVPIGHNELIAKEVFSKFIEY